MKTQLILFLFLALFSAFVEATFLKAQSSSSCTIILENYDDDPDTEELEAKKGKCDTLSKLPKNMKNQVGAYRLVGKCNGCKLTFYPEEKLGDQGLQFSMTRDGPWTYGMGDYKFPDGKKLGKGVESAQLCC